MEGRLAKIKYGNRMQEELETDGFRRIGGIIVWGHELYGNDDKRVLHDLEQIKL